MVARIVRKIRREDYRWYHTAFPISESSIELFSFRVEEFERSKLEKIGQKGAELVRGAFGIAGVDRVYISPYQLSIGISLAVYWEDVESALAKLFERVFNLNKVEFIDKFQAPAALRKPSVPNTLRGLVRQCFAFGEKMTIFSRRRYDDNDHLEEEEEEEVEGEQ